MEMNNNLVMKMSEIFRLMGDANRLRILITCLDSSMSVTELCETVDISQSLVSHNLRLLRTARLVSMERRGKQCFYKISDAHVRCILKDILEYNPKEPSIIE